MTRAQVKLFQVTSVEGLKCLNTLPIFLQSEENIDARVVAMSATEDLNLIVVGLSNGKFILYRGNIWWNDENFKCWIFYNEPQLQPQDV